MKKFILHPALMLAAFLLLVSQAWAGTWLTILHTNDTHSHMLPFESKQFGPDCGGIVRRAGLIEKIRNETGELLLLDAGDILQGTPVYSIFKGEACFKAAKACGYDATTLGNHEFDNGLANLQTQLATSGMRLLCCNVFQRDTNRHVFAPYHVFLRQGLKIGVIGSIGNEAWDDTDRQIRAPLHQIDQITEVRATARRIQPHVDLVVLLSHAGIEFDRILAASVPEVDVLIGGHTHEVLSTPLLIEHSPEAGVARNGLNGTIVAQTGEWGTFLGRINLLVEAGGKIASWSGQLEKVTPEFEGLASPEIKNLVQEYALKLEDIMNSVVGSATSALPFPKDQRKKDLLPMGTFTAMGMREAAQSDICIINSGAIRADLPTGSIKRGAIFEALPYDNSVVTFTMTGAALNTMLDYLAANYGEPDGYQFDGFSGTLNMTTGKAENIQVGGKPVEASGSYRVCTSSFMANGNIAGDKLFATVTKVEDSGVLMRDAALAWLEKHGTIPDLSQPAIRIIRAGH
ncbi:MAG TPA: bifunctional UDP-sugar hydrolase/5'-nucleotidase [Candidatus Rifleibacterium sp.]|nr:bifunctional UDP-sugar hydrolase/5'-nucleotidase [Candidatus Rifleibacterium sp.]